MKKTPPTQLAREIREYLARPGSDPLAATLLPPGQSPAIGPESGAARREGIGRHASPHGSTRYLSYADGRIVSGLQVVSRDGQTATIANVYTLPEHRGQGIAAALVARAQKDFPVVRWPDEGSLSAHGRGLRDKIESSPTNPTPTTPTRKRRPR